jgi:RHS repeat-associated protein
VAPNETYKYDPFGADMTDSSAAPGTTPSGPPPSPSGFSAHYNKLEQTTDMTGIGGGSSLAFSYRGSGQGLRSTAGPSSYTDNALGLGMQQDSTGTTCFTYTPGGDLLSERLPTAGGTCNGRRYYYVTDGQGSVTAVTDSGGTVQDTYTYDPYGATTTTGSVPNPWRYTGGYQDTTGLYKLGARYYSPELMHWTQQDPAGGGCAYAGDDPVNHTDPSGLEPRDQTKRSCDNTWVKTWANKAFVSRRRTGYHTLAWGFQLKKDTQRLFPHGASVTLAINVNGHYYSDGYYHKGTRAANYHWHSSYSRYHHWFGRALLLPRTALRPCVAHVRI